MSRSAERAGRTPVLPTPIAAVVGLALVVLLATAAVGPGSGAPAWAAPSPAAPAPVVDVIAPVVDIVVSSADTGRAVRVDESARAVRFTLDATVLFDRDSARIRPGAGRRLSDAAAEVSSRGPGSLQITGYTDDLGSAAHGLDLSLRRARAVADQLRQRLPTSAYPMTVVGRGEADPVVANTSEANRRLNRRVVVSYRRR